MNSRTSFWSLVRSALAVAVLTLLALSGSGASEPLGSPRVAHAATPIDGSSAACDVFTLSFLGIFDITSFPEPGWVWVDPTQKIKSVSGEVVESFVTHTDFPTVHDTHDQNTHIRVDPGQEGLLADANDPGELETEWEIGTFTNETSGDPPQRTFPQWAWPDVGDRVWQNGNWIFDCGHPAVIGGTNHYHSEIHPPRATAAMRDQVRTLPGTGTTPVRVAATDLYIHGRAGFVMDDLTCGQEIIVGAGSCSEEAYPHRGTPIDDNYDFDVCLPVKPFASAVLAMSMENGPNNSIATDPVLTPQPSAGACADPAFGPMQLHVHVPLAGTGVSPDDTLARKIYAGWVYPPTGLKHITAKLTLGVMHEDQDLDPGDCECSFFWVNVDKSGDEWLRLTPYEIPTDDDSGFGCFSNTNTLNDWDDDGGCGNGHLNFSGPNFDFYVVDGQDYTFRTVAYDQDCLDGQFGNHQIGDTVGGVIVPNLNALALGACFIDPIEPGDNDPYDAAAVVNLAPGAGARVAPGSNQFELFFDVNSAALTVEDAANLSLSKFCQPTDTQLAGQQVQCEILVENPGPGLPRNVKVKDTLLTDVAASRYSLAGATFSFAGSPGSNPCGAAIDVPGGKQFVCDLGTVPLGGTAVIQYTFTSLDGGNFDNSAIVTSDSSDNNLADNQGHDEVTIIPVADLSISKTVSTDPVGAGTAFSYSINVHNAGPSPAVNAYVTDLLPLGVGSVSVSAPGGTCTAGVPGDTSHPTTCNFTTIPPGGDRTMLINVMALPGTLGLLHNDASVSSATLDTNTSNNLATRDVTVVAKADLEVSKTDSADPATAGTALTYTIVVKNNGPAVATGVRMHDMLPLQESLLSSSISGGTGVCALLALPPNVLSCSLNDLSPGASVTVHVTVMISRSVPDGTVLANIATVGTTATDVVPANDAAVELTTIAATADLAIAKTSDADVYKASSTVKYTLTVTNNGPSDAQGVVITDNLPDTKQANYSFDTGGCVRANLVLTCLVGTLGAGQSRSIDVYVVVKGSKGQVANNGVVSSSTFDPQLANNSSTKVVLIGK